jgi:hypothetical protein
LSNDNIYKYFLDNRIVSNHNSIIFGLRELNSNENKVNPPIVDSPVNFTSDYYLRVYTSACYFLDHNYSWKSDGLWVIRIQHFIFIKIYFIKVGPLTNLNETHCFSNHL